MLTFLRPPPPFEPPSLPYLIYSSPLKFAIRLSHRVLLALRSSPPVPAHPIRVVCISDTHTLTQDIPDGDLLIHAGDLTNAGNIAELQSAIDWLSSLPHPHKVVIAGNHDTFLDARSRITLPESDRNGSLEWGQIHYLQHSTKTLTFVSQNDRRLKIYGAPQIPACGGPEFAFQYERGQDAWSDTIPDGVDILVTHTPPKWHRDLPAAYGCEWLLRELWKVQPPLHICGHVHVDAGRETLWFDEQQKAYEAGCERKNGFIRSFFDLYGWIILGKVVVYGVTGVLWDRVWGGERKSTVLVNSALMYHNTGKLGNPVQIVEI